MFSDVERSPSWHSPQLGADFAPHAYPPSTFSGSTARPPVQSGWFPLQDATASSSSSSAADPSRATPDMYSDQAMLPPPAHRPQAQWQHADPYADHRPRGPYDTMIPATPTTPSSAYSPLYGYAGTPVHTPGDGPSGAGFGWQDARPMAPPSIHTTGLEHLRMPAYDDMHRVHTAAQGMHAMMGGVHPMGLTRFASPPSPLGRKKHHREISVGRWTSDEHRVFLKGLELYQGPSWGEIARMIGTRTSTQVRTHAQKFFTKLARSNQVLPYFENQIQKERARLITQGAVPGTTAAATTVTAMSTMDFGSSHSSVTPTSTTAHSYAFSTLSPPRKRGYPSPPTGAAGVHPAQRYDDHSHAYATAAAHHTQPRPTMAPQHGGVPMYPMADPMDPYKQQQHRLDSPPSELLGLRKPARPEYVVMPNDHLHHSQQPQHYGDHAMMAYTPTSDSYRDPNVGSYPPPHPPIHGDWNDAAARSWQPSADLSSEPTHPGDPDSLPSVTRLLYRGGPPTQT